MRFFLYRAYRVPNGGLSSSFTLPYCPSLFHNLFYFNLLNFLTHVFLFQTSFLLLQHPSQTSSLLRPPPFCHDLQRWIDRVPKSNGQRELNRNEERARGPRRVSSEAEARKHCCRHKRARQLAERSSAQYVCREAQFTGAATLSRVSSLTLRLCIGKSRHSVAGKTGRQRKKKKTNTKKP